MFHFIPSFAIYQNLGKIRSLHTNAFRKPVPLRPHPGMELSAPPPARPRFCNEAPAPAEAYKVHREFRTSRRALNVLSVRAGLSEQGTLYTAAWTDALLLERGLSCASRKVCPTLRADSGMDFPLDAQRESMSHFRSGFRDVVSARGLYGKLHPVSRPTLGALGYGIISPTRLPRLHPRVLFWSQSSCRCSRPIHRMPQQPSEC